MREMVRAVLHLLVAVVGSLQVAYAQVAGTESIQAVFSIQNGQIAAYDAASKTIRIFVEERGSVRELSSAPANGVLMALTPLPQGGYAYATGMTRGDSGNPIRVHTVPKDVKSAREVFQYSGERNQATGLVWNQSKLWLGFFESKYFTKVGYLLPGAGASDAWHFTEVAKLRMGDSFDCLGDTLVVGRSYGDQQGEDGDLQLFQKGERQLLPSYRGVRAVKLLGDPTNPSIVIADGWHSNYGQIAQARLSLLRKRQGEHRYALEIIDRDTANYAFSRLFVIELRGRRRIVALGNSTLNLYSEGNAGSWNKEVLYTQAITSTLLDATPVRIDTNGVVFAINDGGLRTVTYRP
jgi:hypothetical protein